MGRTRTSFPCGAHLRERLTRGISIGVLATLLASGCAAPGSNPDSDTGATAPRAPVHCAEPADSTLAAVVRVATDVGAHGSGVVIAKDRVITAAHVVSDAQHAQVAIDGDYRHASVLALDIEADLALLAVTTGDNPQVPISRAALGRSEPVWAVGYPHALARAVTQGRFQHHVDGKLYTSAWITSGNSGGGLLRCVDGRYELAGVLRDYVAYLRDGSYVNADQSTSVPATTLLRFISSDERVL